MRQGGKRRQVETSGREADHAVEEKNTRGHRLPFTDAITQDIPASLIRPLRLPYRMSGEQDETAPNGVRTVLEIVERAIESETGRDKAIAANHTRARSTQTALITRLFPRPGAGDYLRPADRREPAMRGSGEMMKRDPSPCGILVLGK